MGKVIVIFDFDRTLIDGDSDNWVVTEMGLTHLFNQLYRTMPWNALMNRMMMELHSQGKTVDDITQCLKRAPLHPRVIAAIRAVHSYGCDLKIISDANFFFIETILKHHGLFDCFSEIVTNPTFEEDDGSLRIAPFHDCTLSPHGCNLCPPNMCKGLVVNRIQASEPQVANKRFVYLGDGRGDFCPSLKLGRGDIVMPRKGFPLWDCIFGSRDLVKAEVHEWSDGEELARVLLNILDMILTKKTQNGVR